MGMKNNGKIQAESVSSSLVREYLYRKGLWDTLSSFECEQPRDIDSIINRLVLAEELGVKRLLKLNKLTEKPLKTILEVMAQSFMDKKNIKTKKIGNEKVRDVKKISREQPTKLKIGGTSSESAVPTSDNRAYGRQRSAHSDYGPPEEQSRDYLRHYDSVQENDQVLNGIPSSPVRDVSKESSPVKSPIKDSSKVLQNKRDALLASLNMQSENHSGAEARFEQSFQLLSVKSKGTSSPGAPGMRTDNVELNNNIVDENNLLSEQNSAAVEECVVGRGVKSERSEDKGERKSVRVGDLEVDDLEDIESSCGVAGGGRKWPGALGTPISQELSQQLHRLMFGDSGLYFKAGWLGQGLTFGNHHNFLYGLVQKKGGPCGILAAVQAYVLKNICFGSDLNPLPLVKPMHPTPAERDTALAQALCEILWFCGGKKRAVVALSSGRAHFAATGKVRCDGISETVCTEEMTDVNQLFTYLKEHIVYFQVDGGHGCVLALYSAILSRGIDRVTTDMDVPSNTLLGAHGYCTQEMVNLLLIGKAVSNVFDNTIELGGGVDKTILRGIDQRAAIGFLSLFEHYNSCEVGSNYKCPMYPVWVVCSESHFSVLFSIKRDCDNTFDLFHYDGLAKMEEQLKLSIDPNAGWSPREGDIVPPLEQCIRTKWKGASVEWNGHEPIL